MPGEAVTHIVVTDANVLINLIIVERLKLLGSVGGYDFVISDQVYAEVLRPEHRSALDVAIDQGVVRRESLTDISALTLYGELSLVMGVGEAECLAMANHHGWMVLSDEKRLFRREAHRLVGQDRLITTVDLFVVAIRQGAMTVAEADTLKAILAENRFVMKIGTFGDLL